MQKPSSTHTTCSDSPQVSSSSCLLPFPTPVGHRLGEGAVGKTEKKKMVRGQNAMTHPPWPPLGGLGAGHLKFQPIPGETLRCQLPGQHEDDSVYSKLRGCHGNLGPVPLGLRAKVLDIRGGAICTQSQGSAASLPTVCHAACSNPAPPCGQVRASLELRRGHPSYRNTFLPLLNLLRPETDKH